MAFESLRDICNKELNLTKDEWKAALVAIAGLAFVFSFDEWGTDRFDLVIGVGNFLMAFVISALVVLTHHACQRIYGFVDGVKTQFTLWWYGFFIGLVLAIVTNGNIAFLAATGTVLSTHKKLRIGRFRRFASAYEYAFTVLAGIVGVIFLVASLKQIDRVFALPALLSVFINKLYLFGIFFAFWNLLPIPPLDGVKIMYGSRLLYAFMALAFLGYVLLIELLNVFSFVFALIFAVVAWLIYYRYVES